MKSWTERPNIRPPGEQPSWLSLPILFGCLVAAGAIAAAVVCLTGCTGTVVPKIAEPEYASWDGTAQNSGILSLGKDGTARVTQGVRDRFDFLVASGKGTVTAPPLKLDDGLTKNADGSWTMTAQSLTGYIEMLRLPSP